MIHILKLLIFGHAHKWKILETIKVFNDDDDPETSLPIRREYNCQCETCGAIRVFKC